MSSPPELPPLPEPSTLKISFFHGAGVADVSGYSADQMRNYALAALAAAPSADEVKRLAEPVAWQERQQRSTVEWTPWYECRTPLPGQPLSATIGGIQYEWRQLYAAPPAQAPADALDAKRLNWLLANCTQEVTPNGDLGLRFNCDFEHYDDVRGAIDSAMFPPTDSREKQVNVAAQGTAPKGQAVGLTPVAATPTQPDGRSEP